MNYFNALWSTVVANGWTPLFIAIVVFLIVWIMTKLGWLKSGDYQRVGSIVMIFFLTGFTPETVEDGVLQISTWMTTTLINELKNFLFGAAIPAIRKARAQPSGPAG